MTDCSKCKHFIWCDPYKILFYKTTDEPCEEFETTKEKINKEQQ